MYRWTIWKTTGWMTAGVLLASGLCAQTTAISPAADTYLRQSLPNQNQGQETALHVQQLGRNRTLVRMDQAAIAAAVGSGSLASATLELYATSSGSWGPAGRTVDLHRLSVGWTETGATWNCPNDTLLINLLPNCPTQWDGGTFEGEASDSVLHTNATSGYVRFNVTEDVRSFLAGTPNHGWLAKLADETESGNVDYVSRQGTSGRRPRLVLVVESPAFDQVPPSLSITSPSHAVLINETRPQIGLSYGDGGSGVALSSLVVQVDGIAASCTPGASVATCVPATLTEGNHTITASLRDQTGNEATASRSFTLLVGSGRRGTTFAAVGDTYLRQGEPNQNFGGESVLRVRQAGRNRSLVRFDAAEIAQVVGQGTLVAAHLEMTIARNGRNWSPGGRTVDAHRLAANWTEAGATWNCATDTNLSNILPNCPSQWSGGTFQAAPTASVLHTNDLSGTVSFDVTADVASLLNGTPNPPSQGWLLKKREEGRSGLVDYASREAGAAAAPRLVVIFDVPGGEDRTPPSLQITSPGPVVTGDRTPQVVVAYSDSGTGADPSTLRIAIDDIDLTLVCVIEAAEAICESPALLGGTHFVRAEIADRAGNQASAAVRFDLVLDVEDQNPPLLSITSPAERFIRNDPRPDIVAEYLDTVSGIDLSTLRISVDGTDLTANCALTAVAVSCDPPPLASGPHTVRVEVADFEGNMAVDSHSFEVSLHSGTDEVPPFLDIPSPRGLVEGETRPRITVRYSDVESGIDLASLRISLDGVDLLPHCQVSPGIAVCDPPPLTQGKHEVAAEVRDRQGNRSVSAVLFELRIRLEVSITDPAPGFVTSEGEVTLRGTVSPQVQSVVVAGVTATVNGSTFVAANIPLREGSNTLTAVAHSTGGGVGTATLAVVRDSEPPRVLLRTPPAGLVTTSSQILVAGEVVDARSSNAPSEDVTVSVNGVEAEIEHRSFLVRDLLLHPGENQIAVTAADSAGNLGHAEISVFFDAGAPQRIEQVLGNDQSGTVAQELGQPLVIRLIDFASRPLPGRSVTFAVSRGDGIVSSFPLAGRKVTVETDEQGLAQVTFTLGARSGSGIHEVTVTSPGFPGTVLFCASAQPGPPQRIKSIVADDQTGARVGATGQALPKPLMTQVFDAFGNPVSGVEVTYEAISGSGSFAGERTAIVTTDVEGKAGAVLTLGPQEGSNNNVVETRFAGLEEFPAIFTISALSPGPEEETAVTGIVLDPADAPVPGVTVRILGTDLVTTADEQGRFHLAGVPVGTLVLELDGTTATRPGTWPGLHFELTTVSGRENSLGKPVRLPPVDAEGSRLVGGAEDVTIPMRGVPGAELRVFANSATFPDGSKTGRVSFTQVPSDKVPMVAPMGGNFLVAWTIQPPGVHFDPPARVSIANLGAPPGTTIEIFTFDHDLGEFVSAGTASVTENGERLQSNPGSGVSESGWGGCPAPPAPPADACGEGSCFKCVDGKPTNIPKCPLCDTCVGGECRPKLIREVKPTANGEMGSASVGLMQPVRFAANEQGDCEEYIITWDFGDGSTPEEAPAPTHRYREEGEYEVVATVRCKECSFAAQREGRIKVRVKAIINFYPVVSAQDPPSSECNQLPPLVNPSVNIPMLVGAREGSTAALVVKSVNVWPEELTNKALVGVRRQGEEGTITTVSVARSGDDVPIEITSSGEGQVYEIVAGFDLDDDRQLTQDEIKFSLPEHILVRPIPQSDYDRAFSTIDGPLGWSTFFIVSIAQDFMSVFLGLQDTIPGSTRTIDAITLHDQDHPTGQKWTGSCSAPVFHFIFPEGSDFSNTFESSSQVQQAVHRNCIAPHAAEIREFFAAPDSPSRAVFPRDLGTGQRWNCEVSISGVRAWLPQHPGIAGALGAVQFVIEDLEAEILHNAGFFERVKYRGRVDRDIFDFNVKKWPFNEEGALLQAGYPTLGAAGRPFLTSVEFTYETTEWNFFLPFSEGSP